MDEAAFLFFVFRKSFSGNIVKKKKSVVIFKRQKYFFDFV